MRGSGDYDRKKKVQSSVCWVRGSGDYDRKKKIQSSVCWVRGSGNYDRKKKDTVEKKIYYDRKKKDTVVCLMGARFWQLRPGKKEIQLSVCWVRGSGDYDRKKKDTVVCLTGCAVVLFFVVAGNFDYDRKKKKDTVVCLAGARSLLRPEKKDTVVCLLGGRFWQLRLEKKKIQSSVWRVVLLYCFL